MFPHKAHKGFLERSPNGLLSNLEYTIDNPLGTNYITSESITPTSIQNNLNISLSRSREKILWERILNGASLESFFHWQLYPKVHEKKVISSNTKDTSIEFSKMVLSLIIQQNGFWFSVRRYHLQSF